MTLNVAVIAGGGFQGQGIIEAIHAIDGARAILVDSTEDHIGELHADHCVRCPPLSDAAGFEACLLDLVRAESIDWIVPATQRELPTLARLRDRLQELGAHVAVCPEALLQVILDKAALYAELAAAGIAVQPVIGLRADAPYPLFGRPRHGWGGRGRRTLHGYDELAPAERESLASDYVWTPLLEAFDEVSVDFAIDADGRVSPLTLRKRVRVSGGFAVVSDSLDDPAARRQADALASWLRERRACGLFNAQLLCTPDGSCLVSDLNPRHGTSSGHALAEDNRLLAFMMGVPGTGGVRRAVRTVRSLAQQAVPLFKPGAISGIVFDLDDTLLDQKRWMLDRMALAADALADAVPPEALMLETYAALEQGEHARLVDAICERMQRPDLHAPLLDAYRQARPPRAWLYPEVRDVLRSLRGQGIALALLTDNPPASQRAKLAAAEGLEDAFDTLVFSREHGAEKPDPAGFAAAAQALGIAPQHLMMVGDNPARDAVGSIRAGYASCLLLQRPGGRHHVRIDLLRRHAPDVEARTWAAENLRVLPLAVRNGATGPR